jgi:predicted PolB exonuclease-like 3'-5' exonuclease
MLLDRPIIAFDIETIPDPDIGRRLMGCEGDDEAVIREMVKRRLAETENQQEYPQLPWHRVISICAAMLGPESGRVEIRSFGDAAQDERGALTAFFSLFKRELPPRLVSWNGSGFDLPVLRYRAMIHGVVAPGFYRADGEYRFNNYQNRYHDMHLDLMDALTGHGASSRIKLDAFCKTIGLPGKSFIERPIYEHYLSGELPLLVEYCKLDTLSTLLAFLAFAYHRGELPREQLDRYLEGARAAVAAQAFEGWRTIEAALVDWPRWPAERASTPVPE